MPENLCYSLDQLDFLQTKQKTSCSKPLDGFKRVLWQLLLSIPIYGDIIQVDNYRQGTVAQHAMKDTCHHKLKMGGHLHKAHWHYKPLELAPVGNEGQVIR